MNFKYFRLKIVIRVLMISLFMFIFIYSSYQDKWYVTTSVALLVALVLVIELIHFIETINRELGKFMLSIKHKDFTNNYSVSQSKKGSFSELKQAFNEIINEFQHVRIEKELHYQYLQTVFEHAKSAIICFEIDGEIQLINEAAKEFLNVRNLSNIKNIKNINKELFSSIQNCQPESEEVIKIIIDGNIAQFSLQCSVFKLQDTTYKMISLHDIQQALEEQEMESWKKLIRILNHEIMNSVTPISSLSAALNKMLLTKDGQKKTLKHLSNTDANDLVESLETIESRSKGLLKFITTYKQLSKLPKPSISEVNINGLIKHITTLMKPEFKKNQIVVTAPDNNIEIILKIDHEMIEQVLINLILNAMEAVKNIEIKSIEIKCFRSNNQTFVQVSDNGPGIEFEILENIFIPFFTTKKNGSGIGLSLSRQIMKLHKGNILVQTKIGQGSRFILKF